MIALKYGPAWPKSEPLETQLAASVWLFEGKNSEGETLPLADDLEWVQWQLSYLTWKERR